MSEIRVRVQVPTGTSGLSTRSTTLNVRTTPIGLRILPIHVGLLADGNLREHLVSDIGTSRLHVGNADVSQRYVYVKIGLSGRGHLLFPLSLSPA